MVTAQDWPYLPHISSSFDTIYGPLVMERNCHLMGGYDFQIHQTMIVSPSLPSWGIYPAGSGG
jgi:hypothetical protein